MLFTLLLLLASVANTEAQNPEVRAGVYNTLEDYSANRLSNEIDLSDKKNSFTEGRNLVLVIKQGKSKTKINFGEVFGYYNQGDKYRALSKTENKRHYGYLKVLDESGLVLYSKSKLVYKSPHVDYYFSKTPTGLIHNLTLENLKKEYAEFPDFLKMVTKLQRDNQNELHKQDEQGNYRINIIYSETIKK